MVLVTSLIFAECGEIVNAGERRVRQRLLPAPPHFCMLLSTIRQIPSGLASFNSSGRVLSGNP